MLLLNDQMFGWKNHGNHKTYHLLMAFVLDALQLLLIFLEQSSKINTTVFHVPDKEVETETGQATCSRLDS